MAKDLKEKESLEELENNVGVDVEDENTGVNNDVPEEDVEETIKAKSEGDLIHEEQKGPILPEYTLADDGTPLEPNVKVEVEDETADTSSDESAEESEDKSADGTSADDAVAEDSKEEAWTYADQKPYEELPKDDLLDKYYKKAVNALMSFDDMPFADFYMNICNSGTNRFYQKNITETKYFDETWIRTLEGLIPSIDKIIRNPKLSIRYEEEVVAVEKARKINAQSVRHLASHTQLIREVDKEGFVTPKKILTTYTEEEIATYENRFIMTLIRRLYQFVNIRHQIIVDNVQSYQNDHMFYVSNFPIKDEEVELKLDIRVKRDLDNKNINKHNIELLARVDRLMLLVNGFRQSQFMKEMKNAKKVVPPIMKTNVILKNADFRNAYTLWLFLDRYSSLGFDINVRERPVRLSRVYKANLDRISALAYSGLINNKKRRQEDFKVLESIDPIVKKSTKMARTNVADMLKRPDEINIEDNNVNEYYLELNKKVVNNKIKELVEEKYSEVSAVKKIVKESIDITNSMFDSIFNVEENIGYFEKFIFDENPEENYKDAKNKVRFAKILREAKELDLRKTLRLEKSLYNTMKVATNARIKFILDSKKKEEFKNLKATLDKELEAKKKERLRLNDLIKEIDAKLEQLQSEEDVFVKELELLQSQIDTEADEYKKQANDELKKELAEMKAKHKEKMKANTDAHELEMKAKQKEIEEKSAKNKQIKEEELVELRKQRAEALEKAKAEAKEIREKEIQKEKDAEKEELAKQKEQHKKELEALRLKAYREQKAFNEKISEAKKKEKKKFVKKTDAKRLKLNDQKRLESHKKIEKSTTENSAK